MDKHKDIRVDMSTWAEGPSSGPLPLELKQEQVAHEDTLTALTTSQTALRIATLLSELESALERFQNTGKTHTIYLGSCGLLESEQVELLQSLGEGQISIKMKDTDEPVEWYESLISGVWVGTYHNARGEAILRTIEVGSFPAVASTQRYDIQQGCCLLREKAKSLSGQEE